MGATDGFRGLRLHNTLTRRKEDFVPFDPRNVRLYVCGPTVYDHAHIGNARPVVVFDVLYRLLRRLYGAEHVTYVRNITDVDDKINARAAEEGVAIRDLTERTARQFRHDMRALGALDPDVEPRATEHIDEMKAMIETLVAKGVAYVAADHVLFHVAARPDYGRLSGRATDEMLAGARVEVAPYKRDPMDFVLWKPSKPGEPAWPSPCGIAAPGRPGWHIECSAMADKWLWEAARGRLGPEGLSHPHQFDIHGGGIDLVFPHHENELAQSCAAHGTPAMARYWLHNGFLQVEGEKMSKSLGNFVTVHELLEDWPGEAIRLAMMYKNYRQPLDWTKAGLENAYSELRNWSNHISRVFEKNDLRVESDIISRESVENLSHPSDSLINVLNDDLNFAEALAHLRESKFHVADGKFDAAVQMYADLTFLGLINRDSLNIFSCGLNVEDPEIASRYADKFRILRSAMLNKNRTRESEIVDFLREEGVAIISENGIWHVGENAKVKGLIAARAEARKARDWAAADRIRAELEAMGIALKDSRDPDTGELVTSWEVKR